LILYLPAEVKCQGFLKKSGFSSAACENCHKSLGALGDDTVEFVAARFGPNPIRLNDLRNS